MDMKAKYPTLYPQFEKLQSELQAADAKIAPLEAQAEKLRAEADAAEAKWRAVREQIVQLERESDRAAKSRELAALARAMGSRSVKAEPGAVAAKAGQ